MTRFFSRIQKKQNLMILKSTAQSFYETIIGLQCYSNVIVNKVLQVCMSYSTEASLNCHCLNTVDQNENSFFYTDATKLQ